MIGPYRKILNNIPIDYTKHSAYYQHLVGGSVEDACQQYVIALNYILDLYYNHIFTKFNTFNYPYKRAPLLCDLSTYLNGLKQSGFSALQRKSHQRNY